MDLKEDFCVVFFTSTKGHFKYKHLYQKTLENLKTQIGEFNLVAHIKVSPGENDVAALMQNTILELFPKATVNQTEGQWGHVDGTSHFEYIKDIDKNFLEAKTDGYKYGLFLEYDWIFENGVDVKFEIYSAVYMLKEYADILCYRWIRAGDTDIVNRTKAENVYEDLYLQSKEFSFNPCVVRIGETSMIARLAKEAYTNLHPHCEMAFTLAANILHPLNNCFAFRNKPSVVHIGQQDHINILIKNASS